MNWMFVFWHHRYYDELKRARQRLLGEITGQPNVVCSGEVRTIGSNVDISIDNLMPSDQILILAGEQIPVDGRVLRGQGLVDERLIRGVRGLNRKAPEDLVLAGSTLRLGKLLIEVAQHGPETKVVALTQAILPITMPAPGSRTITLRGEKLAKRNIISTLAIAGVGLFLHGVGAAGAILRPDYATGPGLAFPLETLQAAALCLRHGIVIRTPEAFERVATSDLLIIDHDSALTQTD